MAVESIKEVIAMWSAGRITEQQAIGKLLRLVEQLEAGLQEQAARLSKLEGVVQRLEGEV